MRLRPSYYKVTTEAGIYHKLNPARSRLGVEDSLYIITAVSLFKVEHMIA